MKDFIKVLFLLIILFQSCTRKENCSNKAAEFFFNKHLRTIENQKPGHAIDGKTYLSLFFLESVTDLNSSASYGDISYYENQDSIDKDLSRWNSWLQENKCELSLDGLKKAERQVKERNPWIKLDAN